MHPPRELQRPGDGAINVTAACEQAWQGVHELSQGSPDVGTTLELYRREWIAPATARSWLARVGIVATNYQDAILETTHVTPSITELLDYSRRNVWDAAEAARWGWDQGQDVAWTEWARRSGYTWSAVTPAQQANGQPPTTWSDLAWRSQWTTLDIGTATELYRRLRPDRIARWQQLFPDVDVFTLTDYYAAMRANRVPDGLRSYYAVAAYRLMPIRRIQQAYELGAMGVAEVTAQFQDQGYSPADAATQTQIVVATAQKKAVAKLGINPRPAIIEAYLQGTMTQGETAAALYAWDVYGTVAAAPFTAMAQAAKEAFALAQPGTRGTVQQLELQFQTAWTRRAIARIKRRYQRGMWPQLRTRAELANLGIQQPRIQSYLFEWTDELGSGKLLASTGLIRRWVLKGLMPLMTAQVWLGNLGWQPPEIQAILVELQYDLAQEVAKQQLAQAKTLKQQQAAQAKIAQAANKAANKAAAALARTLTPAKAIRYYVHGVITIGQLTKLLQSRGYAGQALSDALADAQIQRTAYVTASAKKAAAAAKSAAGKSSGQPAATPPPPAN